MTIRLNSEKEIFTFLSQFLEKTPLNENEDPYAHEYSVKYEADKNDYNLKDTPKENTKNDKILNLIYKFPTRSRITRARLEDEGQGEQNVKTSIYNKKGLMRKDQ